MNPDDLDAQDMKDEGNMCINAVERIKTKSDRVYKIKYTINMLSQIEEHVIDNLETQERTIFNESISLMSLFSTTEDLAIFLTEPIQQLIEFKWNTFAKAIHYTNAFFHLIHILLIIIFIAFAYLSTQTKVDQIITYLIALLLLGIIYPTFF